MTNIKIPIHNRNLAAWQDAVHKWDIADEDKRDLHRFLQDLALGKVNRGKRISEGRQIKYLYVLKTPLRFFKKPISKITLKDMERFETDLSLDVIRTYRGTPFSASTKTDIRKLLRIYLKWKLGDTERYRKICGWLDTSAPKKTPDYLTEKQIMALYDACQTSAQRFLICILFDGGMRAEEFHNIRYEDIRLPSANENYVKITLKAEYSKTAGRTISLFWKHSLDAVRAYVSEREKSGIRPGDPIFAARYDAMRQLLIRLGRRVLNRTIGYHLFRHSSATYYASKLNRQQLCYRYGWRFSSDMPDTYISRSGLENSELDEKFASTNIEELKARLENQEQQNQILKDWIEKTGKTFAVTEQPDTALSMALSDPKNLKLIAGVIAKMGLVDMMINKSTE
jgi:integrase